MSDSDLQSQIQNALSKEPTLSGDSPRVNVSGDTVELAGNVGTNKEKITATRIVQWSYRQQEAGQQARYQPTK